MKIHLLDIWGLNSERYIVTRHPDNFNMFCLISMGTGEVLAHGSGYHIHRFLEGQNPLQAEYSRIANLRVPGYAEIVVPDDLWCRRDGV